jgi:transketolase
MSEGSIWEALDHARCGRLGNLIAILDMNRLGQRGQTPLGWDAPAYAARARAFGWRAIEIDGHDLDAITAAYREATSPSEQPTFIIAQTVKGKGVSFVEDRNGWHGKALDKEQSAKAIAELGGERHLRVVPRPPEDVVPAAEPSAAPLALPEYPTDKEVATRKAYGDALAAVGAARPRVVALDGEVSNSTYADIFAKKIPDRYFEMFIAEQQMIAAAVGLNVRGRIPFASTFAAFHSRAFDFVRMAAVSRANLRLCGSHAGVSIGADGPSQMGLEDLALMRAVHGSTVLYPSCANQTAKLVAAMVDRPGIVYLRTTREKTAILYPASEDFPIGGSKVVRSSPRDRVTIVAAGITLHEALEAHDRLEAEGISVRVLDAYSVKPIDAAGIRQAVAVTGGRGVVVEDHFPEGGLGEAVVACLGGEDPQPARITHLAVRTIPGSGTAAELLGAAGIDAAAIVDAVHRALAGTSYEKERACWVCGHSAAWRILVGGEDEELSEEDACEEHAHGHRHLAPLPEIASAVPARH